MGGIVYFFNAKGETDMIQNKASQATKATQAMGQSAMDTAEQLSVNPCPV